MIDVILVGLVSIISTNSWCIVVTLYVMYLDFCHAEWSIDSKETSIYTCKFYAFLNVPYISYSESALQNMATLDNWQTAYVVTSTYCSKIKVKINKKERK